MRPAVLTAVLLLVDILNTGTAKHPWNYNRFCKKFPSCGDGWKEVQRGRCAKPFLTPKSFSDAQKHCNSLNSDLMLINDPWSINLMLCQTGLNRHQLQPFWTGAKKTPEGKFRYFDGSEFRTPRWRPVQLDRYKGKDACIVFNYRYWQWVTARCSEKKGYVCIRKK